ncbi:MAG: DUF4326 domain-containing protein [Thaumarchaeota archaeon]|nr:DUF4326 domain-containing protein [Nitrososphaerota archaeon]
MERELLKLSETFQGMRVVHCKKEPYTHYIGRPSLLGNPFTHVKYSSIVEKNCETREESINKFEDYAKMNRRILDAIYKLPEDAILGCWCKPLACHGDVIIKLWKELHE